MSNKQNLISLATREQRERQEIARKGGKAVVAAKRAKKTLKEMFELAIDIYTKKALNDPNITKDQKAILNETNILVLEMMNTALSKKAKQETRLKASDMIMERIHGKPKQEIESKNDTNITIKWEE